jgi:hypothetical protein
MPKLAGASFGFFSLAAGFWALFVWSLQSGSAAGKYAAAARTDTPGLYWFFTVGLAVMALIFLAKGIATVAPKFRERLLVLPGFAVLLPFGLWSIVEMIGLFWKMIAGVPDLSSRLIYIGLAAMVLGVLATLLYTLIWPEVRALWRGESNE